MIIETSDNRFFQVRETGDSYLTHVWYGLPMKKTKTGFVPRKNAKEVLVRKFATKQVG